MDKTEEVDRMYRHNMLHIYMYMYICHSLSHSLSLCTLVQVHLFPLAGAPGSAAAASAPGGVRPKAMGAKSCRFRRGGY